MSYTLSDMIFKTYSGIRLPFSFSNLYATKKPRVVLDSSCKVPSWADLAGSVVDPNLGLNLTDKPFPRPNAWPSSYTSCNQYLPNDTVLNRFIWVVKYLCENGFYVSCMVKPVTH